MISFIFYLNFIFQDFWQEVGRIRRPVINLFRQKQCQPSLYIGNQISFSLWYRYKPLARFSACNHNLVGDQNCRFSSQLGRSDFQEL